MNNTADTKQKKNVHEGHRERLRTRYKRCGFDDFAEHEVLELLLFYSIPRADTNPIAHNLLDRFGSLYAVMNASYDDLCEVEGVGPASAALIRTVADTARAARLKEIGSEPLLSADKLHTFATEWFLGAAPRTAAILLLDEKHKVITTCKLAEDSLRLPEEYHEMILRLCQQMDAKYAVLMHNHTDGIMRPSGEDIQLTRDLYEYLADNGITLLEHLIVHELDCIQFLDLAMRAEVSGFPMRETHLPPLR